MLTCPYCKSPVTEQTPRCPQCSLTLAAATQLLGPIPQLNKGLTDTSATLSPKSARVLARAIKTFESKFATSQLNIVLQAFPSAEKCNLSTYLFWLFNTSGLSLEEQRNGCNQDILIGMDPDSGRLGIMFGYGLEPFFEQKDLDKLLNSVKPALEKGEITTALIDLITQLEHALPERLEEASLALGLPSPSEARTSVSFD